MNKLTNGLVILLGILGILILVNTQETISNKINFFTYYTIQSNLMAIIIAIYSIISKKRTYLYKSLKLGVTLIITATAVIFHIMLADTFILVGIEEFANQCLHTYVPVLFLISNFTERNSVKLSRYTPLLWLVYPFIYFTLSLIRGSLTGYYPYWFMNPYKEYPLGVGSYGNVALLAVILVFGFIIVSYLFIGISNLLTKSDK